MHVLPSYSASHSLCRLRSQARTEGKLDLCGAGAPTPDVSGVKVIGPSVNGETELDLNLSPVLFVLTCWFVLSLDDSLLLEHL